MNKPRFLVELLRIAKDYDDVAYFNNKTKKMEKLPAYDDGDIKVITFIKVGENGKIESVDVSIDDLKKTYTDIITIIHVYFMFKLVKETTETKVINNQTTKKLLKVFFYMHGVEVSDYVCQQIVSNL